MDLLVYKLHDSSVDAGAAHVDSKLVRLRSEIYLHPEKDWTVRRMADMVFLSESRLHTMYKETFHVTCMNDVIMSRIQYAQNMLECTTSRYRILRLRAGTTGTNIFAGSLRKKRG